jgi:hypothetical protein
MHLTTYHWLIKLQLDKLWVAFGTPETCRNVSQCVSGIQLNKTEERNIGGMQKLTAGT